MRSNFVSHPLAIFSHKKQLARSFAQPAILHPFQLSTMNAKTYNTACAISTMNDSGIHCITSGKREEASFIFQQSLREVRRQMTTEMAPAHDVITTFQPIATEACNHVKMQDRFTHDACFEIYDIAFSIKFLNGNEANLAFGAAAMLYNMALNDHVTFISTGASNHLKRATSLYKKALQIMFSQDEQDEDCGKCLFLLALCNNLGHCFTNVCDVHGKKTCKQQLEYILSDPECASYLSMEDFEFFHLNSLVASADVKAASAA